MQTATLVRIPEYRVKAGPLIFGKHGVRSMLLQSRLMHLQELALKGSNPIVE